ncbi:MAG: DUF4352 domain-containing protein [Bryobacteraceae bacterium]|nr:DUF4352 domain-containing protein [Bryobacteraceae bacterium]
MKQNEVTIQAGRRDLLKSLPLAALALAVGCGGKKASTVSHQMGEKVSIGKLMYSVLHGEWKINLGEGGGQRVPEHRFLVLDVSISNSGSEEVALPLFSLHDAKGKTYRELENGESVENWMGLLRTIAPVQTLRGSILFDVPLTSYKLEVTDGGPAESEVTALIDIPLQMEADPVLSTPPEVKKD